VLSHGHYDHFPPGHDPIDHAFGDLGYDVLVGGARVSNPASRRVLQKCGFEWTGVGLYRIRALASSAPVDRSSLAPLR
jgi:hypothetical protein